MLKKEKTSYSSDNLKSHTDKYLEDHLLSVGNICREIVISKKLNLDNYVDFEVLQDISYLIGVTHDFGKATSYFQNYINEKDEIKKIKLKNKPETHHGFISSIFTYYIIKKYLSDKNFLNEKYYQYFPIICFLVVKKHHGNLDNLYDEINCFGEDEERILKNQIEAIDFYDFNKIYKELFQKINFIFDCNMFKDKILSSEPVYIYGKLEKYEKQYQKDLEKERKLVRDIDEEPTLFYYFITLFLYSILLDADKMDAAELERIERIDIDENIVGRYRKIKFDNKDRNNKINRVRNEIYKEVISKVKSTSLENGKILSLNVPTGTGKTLTSLSFSLKLRKRIEKEKGYSPKIIYSLPFLSIIDQNFDEFENVFKSINRNAPESNILLKHHHLSEVVYNIREREFEGSEEDVSKDLLLIEGWNSEIIVTTFMQFFYSFISNKNRAIRKFHNIVNSIVILDEIQTIPHKYWLLLNKTIKFFAEHFNAYFIFVTATQPLIFDEKSKEIKPLVINKRKYFEVLDRVNLTVKLECIDIDDFKEEFKKDILENSNKDFLIVLNTINSSKEIYNFINNLKLKKTILHYLSTNIIPRERLKRIKDIKKESTERKIIISTQLIEAGVDIDVDIVYRDFAPLDSINQVAGRCNRNFDNKKGIVKVFILKEDSNGKTYYPHTIYESFIIDKSKEVFKDNRTEISECNFLQLSEDYFKKINETKSDDNSRSILRYVEELKFDELSKFQLIEEKGYYKMNVFIEIDNEAKEIWSKYQDIVCNKENTFLKRRNEFLKIKKQFYDFVILVPVKFKNELTVFDDKSELGYISNEDLESLYSSETGFKTDNITNKGLFV